MINEIRRYLQKRVKKVSENVFNEKFSKYLRKLTKCKEAGGDLQKRNKNVNVTFLIRVFEKFSKTYPSIPRSEEHTSELQSHSDLVCRLLLEKKNDTAQQH